MQEKLFALIPRLKTLAKPRFVGFPAHVVKGATTTTAVSMLLFPVAYAQTGHNDSVKVVTIVQGIDSVDLRVKEKTYKISDVTKLTILKQDSITVIGGGISKTIAMPKKKEFVLKIELKDRAPTKVQEEKKVFQGKYLNMMRGMFAQKYEQEEPLIKKLEISIE